MAVEDNAVCNDDHRIEHRFAVFIVQRGEPIGDPRNGVRLAAARRMFDEVAFARAVFLNVGNDFVYDVILMIAREDQLLFFDISDLPVPLNLFLFGNETDKFIDQVKQAVALQNLFPQIGSCIAVGIDGVSFAAFYARTVAALIERKKTCCSACKLRRHIHFV